MCRIPDVAAVNHEGFRQSVQLMLNRGDNQTNTPEAHRSRMWTTDVLECCSKARHAPNLNTATHRYSSLENSAESEVTSHRATHTSGSEIPQLCRSDKWAELRRGRLLKLLPPSYLLRRSATPQWPISYFSEWCGFPTAPQRQSLDLPLYWRSCSLFSHFHPSKIPSKPLQ